MSERIRVAVLGAGGRVGYALLARLSADPRFSAFGVVRNAVIAGPIRIAGLEVRTGSVRDATSAGAALGRPDAIVNCAVDAGWATTAPAANQRLLRAVGGIPRRLVQLSSIGVYGTCITRGRATADRPRPHARYAREKLDQERAALRYGPPDTTVFRMGHVYGPYQWLSRSIFDMLAAGAPGLPFDGHLESNAVHVENVCRAVAAALSGEVPAGAYDLVDRPQRTWRELVDWHADAIGVAPLGALPDAESRDLARRYRSMETTPVALQLVREMGAAIASLPSSFAVSSPTAVVLGQRLLAWLGRPGLEARLRAAYFTARARQGLAATGAAEAPPWMLSDETPGRALEYRAHAFSIDDQRALAEWHGGYTLPPSIGITRGVTRDPD